MTSFDSDESEPHLPPGVVAGYVSGTLTASARSEVEGHLAECDVCRSEVVAVNRLMGTSGKNTGRWFVLPLAAAAAVLLLAVWNEGGWLRPVRTEFREPMHSMVYETPTLLAPIGTDTAPVTFRWSPVAGADRYRISLFDSEGSVLWENEVSRSSDVLPDSIRLTPGVAYVWQVEARLGVGRWSATPLTEFRIGRPER